MKNFTLVFLLIFLAILPCFSAETTDPNVELQMEIIQSGENLVFTANFNLVKGFHIYPESIELEFEKPWSAGSPTLPEIHEIKDFTGQMIKVYEGNFEIRYPLSSSEKTLVPVKGKITYSGCTDINCFPPVTKEFSLEAKEIVPFKTGLVIKNPPKTLTVSKDSTEKSENIFNKSWYLRILLAIMYGFLASLTPCILPMIPITVSIIGSMAPNKEKYTAFMSSIVFVLGLCLTYSVLGVFAAMTGKAASSIMQSQGFLIFIFLLFLFFALAIIEVLPFKQISAGSMETSNKKGYLHIFLFGLISGLIASPCTGPILLSLLAYIATTGSLFEGFILLFCFALGMGILFIVVGTGIGSIRPSGNKMMFIKALFGFMMALTSLYYLSLAFKGWMLYLPASLICFFFATALEPEYDILESRGLYSFQKIFCWFFIALGLICFYESAIEFEWIQLRNNSAQISQTTLLPWNEGLEEYNKLIENPDEKPIFVKFQADWCTACKKYKKTVLEKEVVQNELKNFHRIIIDLTQSNDSMKIIFDQLGIKEVMSLPKALLISSDRKRNFLFSGAISIEETLQKLEKIK